MGAGSCAITDAYNAAAFKKVAHCIVPPSNKFDLTDQFDFALGVRNALDLALEYGMRSILYRHPFLLFDRLVAKILLLTVKRWLDESPYSGAMERVVIL